MSAETQLAPSSWRAIGRRVALLIGLAPPSLAGCSPAPEPSTPALGVASESTGPRGPQRSFAFTTLDGKAVSSEGYRGRMTLIGMVATYDMGSQAQARFLSEVARKHVPRVNVLLVVLEPAHHRPMVEAFAGTLNLPFDVVHADERTTAGDGPFPGLHHVPSVVLLDREGREVWRNLGLVSAERLREEVADRDPRAR